MRILHTIGRLGPGRLDSAILDRARWQAAHGCQVILAVPRGALAEAAPAAGLKLEIVELASRFAEREAALLRAAVRRHAIEVIHVHDDAASLPALMSGDMFPVVRSI